MDAMILAAGLGTRLRPLTDSIPKALVPVAGVPMLEHVARRLIAAGVDRIVINTHHFGERIAEFVEERGGWGVEVHISHEPDHPLDTGGGLLNAAPFLHRNAPFFIHNADILTDLPLVEMYRAHQRSTAIATLAAMSRESSRGLIFDHDGLLGRVDTRKEMVIRARPPHGDVERLAFAGVHVVSPEFLDMMAERSGVFPIWDAYLDAVARGSMVGLFRADPFDWLDIGRPEELAKADALALAIQRRAHSEVAERSS